MPKKKKKPTRKTKKKTARPAKRTRGKTSARKKKPVRRQSRKGGVLAIELTEIDVIGGGVGESVEETESSVINPFDEQFPPDYGGSE
jgi:hypothetical protein